MNETLNRYPIDEKRVKTLHIFNVNEFKNKPQMTRIGSLVDVKNLTDTFESLNFKVKVYSDLTSTAMKEQFEKLGNEDHSNRDLFFCVIMSHGNRINGVDVLTCGDNVDVSLNELLKPIKECMDLINKPKIVFVQACRGESEFEVEDVETMTDTTVDERMHNIFFKKPLKDKLKINKVSPLSLDYNMDYVIFYSTTRDFLSKRHPTNGTPFVQVICEVFKKHVKKLSLEGMIKFVIKELKGKGGQVPEIMGSMSRSLYFTKVSLNYNT